MLYKKYHRNYVRKFRKGTKFMECMYYKWIVCEVNVEPFIDDTIKVNSKVIKNDVYTQVQTTIINYNGRLKKKDVV